MLDKQIYLHKGQEHDQHQGEILFRKTPVIQIVNQDKNLQSYWGYTLKQP
jgi:hypothetical protein